MTDGHIQVVVDGKSWTTVSPQNEYDTIHVVAGALLAGAERVEIRRGDADG